MNNYRDIPDFRLQDQTRVDCMTNKHAIEYDHTHDWYESIAQASTLFLGKLNRDITMRSLSILLLLVISACDSGGDESLFGVLDAYEEVDNLCAGSDQAYYFVATGIDFNEDGTNDRFINFLAHDALSGECKGFTIIQTLDENVDNLFGTNLDFLAINRFIITEDDNGLVSLSRSARLYTQERAHSTSYGTPVESTENFQFNDVVTALEAVMQIYIDQGASIQTFVLPIGSAEGSYNSRRTDAISNFTNHVHFNIDANNNVETFIDNTNLCRTPIGSPGLFTPYGELTAGRLSFMLEGCNNQIIPAGHIFNGEGFAIANFDAPTRYIDAIDEAVQYPDDDILRFVIEDKILNLAIYQIYTEYLP